MATKTHKGLLAECPTCSGVQPEREFKRKKTGIADTSARRQANQELGEDPTRLQKDAVMMKYGIHDPVIDRNVKKPYWKSEVVWKNEMKTWEKETSGMVPRQRYQESRRGYTPKTASSTSNQEFRPRNPKFNPRTPSLPPTEFRNSPRGS